MPELAKESGTARSVAQSLLLTTIAERLREAMAENDETYRSLAKKAGVSSGTISALLTGKDDPQLLTLIKVAAALGFSSLESVFGDISLPTESHLTQVALERGPRD